MLKTKFCWISLVSFLNKAVSQAISYLAMQKSKLVTSLVNLSIVLTYPRNKLLFKQSLQDSPSMANREFYSKTNSIIKRNNKFPEKRNDHYFVKLCISIRFRQRIAKNQLCLTADYFFSV